MFFKIRSIALLIPFCLLLAGCGGGGSDETEVVLGLEKPFEIPQWSGPYEVGVREFWLHDVDREESFTEDPSDTRSVLITIFYPATVDDNLDKLKVIHDFYWDENKPLDIQDNKRLRKENYQDAYWDIYVNGEVSEEKQNYPLLIYSHGHANFRPDLDGISAAGYDQAFITNIAPTWAGEVASQGYILATIFHPYGVAGVLEDGKIASAVTLPENDGAAHLPIWISDQRFALDQIELMNSDKDSFLFSKVSLKQIGVFGHSYGGAAAFHTLDQDDRVRAGLAIDSTIYGFDDIQLKKPFATYVAGGRDNLTIFQKEQGFDQFQSAIYKVEFNGFEHSTFGGGDIFWQWDYPDWQIGNGTVNAEQVQHLVSQSVIQYFDKFLRGGKAPWLDDHTQTPPELTVTKF